MKRVMIALSLTDEQAKTLDEDGPAEWLAHLGHRRVEDFRPRVVSVADMPGRYGVESWDSWEQDRTVTVRGSFRTAWFDTPEQRDLRAAGELNDMRTVRLVIRTEAAETAETPEVAG